MGFLSTLRNLGLVTPEGPGAPGADASELLCLGEGNRPFRPTPPQSWHGLVALVNGLRDFEFPTETSLELAPASSEGGVGVAARGCNLSSVALAFDAKLRHCVPLRVRSLT